MTLIKYVTVKIEYESNEIWEQTQKDIDELMKMMNNITRTVTIIEIAEE